MGRAAGARRIRLILLAATALAGPAAAADVSWTGTGILWEEASGWDLGVPGSTDVAIFGASDPAFVAVISPAEVGSIRFLPTASAFGFDIGADMTISNGIDNQSGTAQAFNIYGGTLSFTGGTITGPVTLANGAKVTFENASAGDATINNTNNGFQIGTVTFKRGGNGGAATIDNQGQVIFEGGSSAGAAEITNDGFGATTSFKGDSTAGEATIENINNGKLDFNGSATAASATITNKSGFITFDDESSAGDATLVNDASGMGFRTIIFNDDTTAATSVITTSGGSVNFYENTTADRATITANAGGAIRFQDGSTAGDATLIANNGGLIEIRLESSGGKARLVLNEGGVASIEALTTAGTTLGSIEGKGTLKLGGKELTVGGIDLTTVFDGVITGAGARFIKSGIGALTLGGDSSAFAGDTEITSGTLIVEGKLGGFLNVLGSGRLEGSGTVGETKVSGVIAPGSLTVDGDLIFNRGAGYEVAIDGTEASRITVNGEAYLDGMVKVIAGPGPYRLGVPYTILTASEGRFGEFTGVASDFVFVDLGPIYYDDRVDLAFNRNDVGFAEVAETRNQRATAQGVEILGGGKDAYDALSLLSAADARAALDQMSGEIHASIKSMLSEDSRFLRTTVMSRLQVLSSPGNGTAMAAAYDGGTITPAADLAVADGSSGFWLSGYGAWGSWDGDGNAASLGREVGGSFIGADTELDGWRIGLMGGISHASLDVDNRNSSGSVDGYYFGIYGGTEWQSVTLRAGAAYGWNDIETKRKVTNPLVQDLDADYGAGAVQVFGELAYIVDFGGLAVLPFVQSAYVNVHTESFEETGGSLALKSKSDDAENVISTLGLRPEARFDLGAMPSRLRGLVGWRHVFGNIEPQSTFAFAGGEDFDITGVPVARDAAVVEAGLDIALSDDAGLGLSYGGQFGSGTSDQSVTGKLTIDF